MKRPITGAFLVLKYLYLASAVVAILVLLAANANAAHNNLDATDHDSTDTPGGTAAPSSVQEQKAPETLFGESDSVIELLQSDDVNTTHSTASSCPWVFLYYDSSCGHCRAFAPEFSAVAANSSMVEARGIPVLFGALNCLTDEAICRARGISDVPTLFFVHPAVGTRPAYRVSLPAAQWRDGLRSNLNEVADELFGLGPSIGEGANSATRQRGEAASLDTDRKVATDACSALREFFRARKLSQIVAARSLAHSDQKHYQQQQQQQQLQAQPPSAPDMTIDIAGGLFFTLWHEVSMVKWTPHTREVLGDFLALASATLPGLRLDSVLAAFREDPFMTPGAWKVAVRNAGIPFVSVAAAGGATRSDGHPSDYFSTTPQWSVCRGSGPQFRGFPCSLWLTYHTILASAPRGTRFHALLTIRRYILTFFFCAECRNHFREFEFVPDVRGDADGRTSGDDSSSDDLSLPSHLRRKSPFGNVGRHQQQQLQRTLSDDDAAVLMLWRAHNNVNCRLAASASTDPRNPKVAFPTKEACPSCFKADHSPDRGFNQQLAQEAAVIHLPEQDGDHHPTAAPDRGFDGNGGAADPLLDPASEFSRPAAEAATTPSQIYDEARVLKFLLTTYDWDRAVSLSTIKPRLDTGRGGKLFSANYKHKDHVRSSLKDVAALGKLVAKQPTPGTWVATPDAELFFGYAVVVSGFAALALGVRTLRGRRGSGHGDLRASSSGGGFHGQPQRRWGRLSNATAKNAASGAWV